MKGDSEGKSGPGRPSRPDDLSTRSDDAKTIKVTEEAWEILRRAKFELEMGSYSDAIIFMEENPGKGPKQLTPEIKTKVPSKNLSEKELKNLRKTIVISKQAHDILRRLKFINYLESYSEAVIHLNKMFRNLKR